MVEQSNQPVPQAPDEVVVHVRVTHPTHNRELKRSFPLEELEGDVRRLNQFLEAAKTTVMQVAQTVKLWRQQPMSTIAKRMLQKAATNVTKHVYSEAHWRDVRLMRRLTKRARLPGRMLGSSLKVRQLMAALGK